MFKYLVLCMCLILGQSLAAVETNKRGGHGIFHGLEDTGGKSSWLEESKVDSVKISKGNTNSLLSNTDVSSKKSSLYLQPEPRGLEYLLDVPDQNPLLMNFYRKRRDSSYFSSKLRRARQINLQPGNVIPGSLGQSVLYGVPSGINPAGGPQPVSNNQGTPSGKPSGFYPGGFNPQDTHIGGYKTYGY